MPPSLTKLFEGFGEIQEAAALEKKITQITEVATGLLPPSEQKKLRVDDVFQEAAGDGKVRTVLELYNMNDPAERFRCSERLNDPAYIPAQRVAEWGRNAAGESVLFYFIAFTVQVATYEKWTAQQKPAPEPESEGPVWTEGVGPVEPHLPRLGWTARLALWLASQLGR